MVKRNERWVTKYGPWAVVTGASDGIGRACAYTLAERGVNVVLVARRRGVLDEIAGDIESRHAVKTRIVAVDLGERSSFGILARETADIDVGLLVASAGFGTSGLFIESEIETELSMVDLNCAALMALTHHYGKRFASRRCGGIILMSSIVAFQGVPFAADYAATKAYVQTLAEGLRPELKPHGVEVLASAPAQVRSGFAERADMRMGAALTPQRVARGTINALGRRTTVRPGFLSKFLEAALKLPRMTRTRIMKIVMGGMTAHRRAA